MGIETDNEHIVCQNMAILNEEVNKTIELINNETNVKHPLSIVPPQNIRDPCLSYDGESSMDSLNRTLELINSDTNVMENILIDPREVSNTNSVNLEIHQRSGESSNCNGLSDNIVMNPVNEEIDKELSDVLKIPMNNTGDVRDNLVLGQNDKVEDIDAIEELCFEGNKDFNGSSMDAVTSYIHSCSDNGVLDHDKISRNNEGEELCDMPNIDPEFEGNTSAKFIDKDQNDEKMGENETNETSRKESVDESENTTAIVTNPTNIVSDEGLLDPASDNASKSEVIIDGEDQFYYDDDTYPPIVPRNEIADDDMDFDNVDYDEYDEVNSDNIDDSDQSEDELESKVEDQEDKNIVTDFEESCGEYQYLSSFKSDSESDSEHQQERITDESKKEDSEYLVDEIEDSHKVINDDTKAFEESSEHVEGSDDSSCYSYDSNTEENRDVIANSNDVNESIKSNEGDCFGVVCEDEDHHEITKGINKLKDLNNDSEHTHDKNVIESINNKYNDDQIENGNENLKCKTDKNASQNQDEKNHNSSKNNHENVDKRYNGKVNENNDENGVKVAQLKMNNQCERESSTYDVSTDEESEDLSKELQNEDSQESLSIGKIIGIDLGEIQRNERKKEMSEDEKEEHFGEIVKQKTIVNEEIKEEHLAKEKVKTEKCEDSEETNSEILDLDPNKKEIEDHNESRESESEERDSKEVQSMLLNNLLIEMNEIRSTSNETHVSCVNNKIYQETNENVINESRPDDNVGDRHFAKNNVEQYKFIDNNKKILEKIIYKKAILINEINTINKLLKEPIDEEYKQIDAELIIKNYEKKMEDEKSIMTRYENSQRQTNVGQFTVKQEPLSLHCKRKVQFVSDYERSVKRLKSSNGVVRKRSKRDEELLIQALETEMDVIVMELNKGDEKINQGLEYQCSVCRQIFMEKKNLSKHFYNCLLKYTQSGKQSFKCSICHEYFSLLTALTTHLDDMHLDLICDAEEGYMDPYQCGHCSLIFKNEHTLLTHVLTHDDVYRCKPCNKYYRDKKICDLHIKKKHKDTQLNSEHVLPLKEINKSNFPNSEPKQKLNVQKSPKKSTKQTSCTRDTKKEINIKTNVLVNSRDLKVEIAKLENPYKKTTAENSVKSTNVIAKERKTSSSSVGNPKSDEIKQEEGNKKGDKIKTEEVTQETELGRGRRIKKKKALDFDDIVTPTASHKRKSAPAKMEASPEAKRVKTQTNGINETVINVKNSKPETTTSLKNQSKVEPSTKHVNSKKFEFLQKTINKIYKAPSDKESNLLKNNVNSKPRKSEDITNNKIPNEKTKNDKKRSDQVGEEKSIEEDEDEDRFIEDIIETRVKIQNEIKKAFKCKRCLKIFIDKININKHIIRKHIKISGRLAKRVKIDRYSLPSNVFKCKFCINSFKTYNELLDHYIRNHNGMPCNVCDIMIRNKMLMEKHLNTCHDINERYKCVICNQFYKSKHTFRKHLSVHEDKRPYECIVCYRSFRYSYDMRLHMRRLHFKQFKLLKTAMAE